MAHYLQVDIPIIMRMGNGEGLGDPSMKGALLKLTDPRHDTGSTSREGIGPLMLRHL